MAPEEEINKLKAELERHNKLYHQDDNPEIVLPDEVILGP